MLYLECKYSFLKVSSVPHSESFVEDPKFPERPLAASVASKLLFNLEDYDDSLRLALIAGDMFDLNEKSQYVEVLIVKCMESYKDKR